MIAAASESRPGLKIIRPNIEVDREAELGDRVNAQRAERHDQAEQGDADQHGGQQDRPGYGPPWVHGLLAEVGGRLEPGEGQHAQRVTNEAKNDPAFEIRCENR
jgi:hypothetical protein